MRYAKIPLVSLESIQFQSDTFYKELAGLIARYKGKARFKIFNDDLPGQLSKVIHHHTGLDVNVYMGVERTAKHDVWHSCIIIPYTKNNAISPERLQRDIKLKGLTATSFSVNERTGRIKAGSVEFNGLICLPASSITGTIFTAEEEAAMLLHELGHLVGNLHFMGQLTRTNEALKEIAHGYTKTNDYKERVSVIGNSTRELQINKDRVAEIAQAEELREVSIMLVNDMVEGFRNELDSPEADKTMFECYADNYAVRYGAGLALLSALHKRHRHHIEAMSAASRSQIYNFMIYMATLTLTSIIMPVTSIILGTLAIVTRVASAVKGTIFKDERYLYPDDKYRKEKIRHQLSLVMRNPTLSKEQVQYYKTVLEQADEILANTEVDSQFSNWLGGLLSRKQRRFIKQNEIQQAYEALAFNKLYERSQYLRHA